MVFFSYTVLYANISNTFYIRLGAIILYIFKISGAPNIFNLYLCVSCKYYLIKELKCFITPNTLNFIVLDYEKIYSYTFQRLKFPMNA